MQPTGLPTVADGRPLRRTDQSGPQSAVWLAEADGRPKRRAIRRLACLMVATAFWPFAPAALHGPFGSIGFGSAALGSIEALPD
ncbi:hypothetical protein HMPREF0972_00204 [Actinomyces sp. oral taxon 848 str. F0332]|nr:hypothetical protein HMPREF0972_00204 [Actinomyces sp. oral taxon 848 str. F0332]